jgi:hypothetical protein
MRGVSVRCVQIGFVVLSALTSATSAFADEASVAETLFQRGVAAMERGDLATACADLAESQRLDPGGGTVLNLALCHEKAGRLATAWARYREALGAAHRDARADRVTFAETHLAALEPRLSHVTLTIAAPLPNMRATVDGVELPSGVWESGAPLDAGEHELRVDAPARKSYRLSFTVREAETKRVDVPTLVPAEVDRQREPSPGSTQRVVGWSLAGAGASAVVASAILGGLAIGAQSTADAACPGSAACDDPRGLAASRRATSFATAATVSIASGLVVLAGGVVLLLTAPSAKPVQRGTRTSVIGPLSDFAWKK